MARTVIPPHRFPRSESKPGTGDEGQGATEKAVFQEARGRGSRTTLSNSSCFPPPVSLKAWEDIWVSRDPSSHLHSRSRKCSLQNLLQELERLLCPAYRWGGVQQKTFLPSCPSPHLAQGTLEVERVRCRITWHWDSGRETGKQAGG